MTEERDLIEYDQPGVLSEVFPDRDTTVPWGCTACGDVLPADQMMVTKIHHALFAEGYLYTRCPYHFAAYAGSES
ncbi:hypothetical protein [Nocardiopsis aegyptia]|uniref:Uncharacterized protein n=1 Tax=Nocardiopsis aegyptia TaxID=220378 RepID=A0A7Z0ETR6_9ACTN|nr:hypothetical protein [Nocardiopsis aegyptia]NYJ38126.1 hypothetical protein [Nocardiopsis aegyptia]